MFRRILEVFWPHKEVQTRNHDGQLRYFASVHDALEHAIQDPDVWKVSFSLPNGERVRLVREMDGWMYETIMGDRY